MRIVISTDAWMPQINGVVRTLTNLITALRNSGHEVHVIEPQQFNTVPMPGYSEIRLAVLPDLKVRRLLWETDPDAIHIVTEGPIGAATRCYCKMRRLHFTTSFHTRFPEYIKARVPVLPLWPGYAMMNFFHGAAERTMVSTPQLREELSMRGMRNLVIWPRGVDTEMFQPMGKDFLEDGRPIFMYVGRVSVEKNVEDFLLSRLPGTKYVVGDGPARTDLERQYPDVRFVGTQVGEDLVRYISAADCLVFPSRTDSLGLVVMEALACGVPVAAYPVLGPSSILRNGVSGYLDEDLSRAALKAVELDPQVCRQAAMQFSLQNSAEIFLEHLVPTRHKINISILDELMETKRG